MSNVEFDFSGRTALVTGATKGIGREIALRLASSGCNVAATGRDEEQLRTLCEEIESCGVSAYSHACDLARPDQIAEMGRSFTASLSIDYLVNNAGVTHVESILETSIEHWDEIINVNLRAPLLVAQTVIPSMLARGAGAIVNIGSLAGEVVLEDHAAYCASKWGLHGLSKVMALELGPRGIRVNTVAPTVVLTPMGREVWGESEKADPMIAKIPLGRFIETHEVADTVLFLLSDGAAMVNGTVAIIDGGYSIA